VKGARADVEVDVDGTKRRGAVDLPERDTERTLALFVAELARTSDAPPPPAPTPTPPPEKPPPSERPSSDDSHLAILATMGGRILFRDGSLILTPRAEVGWQWSRLRVGGIARYGTVGGDDPLGSVRAHLLTLGLAASQHLSPESSFSIAHGPRVEAGFVTAKGSGTNGANARAFNATAAWELEARAIVARPVTLVFAIDLGILFPGLDLRADDRTVIDLAGPFASASVGVSF